MTHLSISLLGSMTVTLDGQTVTSFEYDKVRALLTYLAVEWQRPHRREALAGLFWPDQSEKAAHDSLRNALSKLRHAIGDQAAQPPYLIINREEIQFNLHSDSWLDVERFTQLLEACRTHRHRRIEGCPTCTDRLIEAINLYHGNFLEGFSLADSDLFEDWIRIKREEYLQLALETLQQLASTYEWRGEPAKALVYTQRQLKLDPCREESYTQAMRLYASLGMRSEACEQYEKCRELLANELGVEPAEETTRLYEQIKYGVFLAAPSLDKLRINNLPPNLTSFVGREQELKEINSLIEDPACRLLTLVGPGGVGKTRLAIAAAGQQLEAFPHGACFVPLAGISSIEAIVPTILKMLGLLRAEQVELKEQAESGDLKQQLIDYLRDKELILLLDNFEHLVEGAGMVTEILQKATAIMVLITSRQRLGLQAEWLFEVNGLSYPSGKAGQDLAAYDSVQLFTARLHQVKTRVTLFKEDLPSVSRICQLVEGLPLGIELAASAVRRKSIEQVATAIESGKEDLQTSWKDVPERHRSLRAVFEQSWQLLTHEERRVFCGLAIFRSGFTTEAAGQVAEAAPVVLDSLMDHSMIRFNPNKERYDLHELLRQYGLDKLRAQGMESNLRQRHGRYFLQALKRWGTEQEGAGQVAALTEMDQELVDIQTAWEWACQRQDLAGLTQGQKGICRYYQYRSRPLEGERDCQVALEVLEGMTELSPQGQILKAQLLTYQSSYQIDTGRIDSSIRRQVLEKCIQILESLQQAGVDVRLDMAWILKEMGSTIAETDPKRAIQFIQKSLDIARQSGNRYYQAISLEILGYIYYYWYCEYQKAEVCCQEALIELRALGDTFRISHALQTLSEISIYLGKVEVSLQASRESAQHYRLMGDRYNYAEGLTGLGLIFMFARQWEEADKAFRDSLPYIQDLGNLYSLNSKYSNWCLVKIFSGQYETVRTMAQSNLDLANQLDNTYAKLVINYVLGCGDLAQGQVEQAAVFLEKAATFANQRGNRAHWAWVVGTWCIALNRMGQARQAQELLVEALQIGVELHSYPSLSFALPAAAFMLANAGQVERAVELCALIDEHAMCGKTPWFEDVAGKSIKEMAASLPPEVVEAARQRGRQRDLFSTAAELLEEFKGK